MALSLMLALCLPLAAETPADIRDMVRRSLANLNKSDERRDGFLYRGRNERKEFDSSGKVKSHRINLWERFELEGHVFGRTLERDGKPLTEAERQQQDAAIQKRLAELKAPRPASPPPPARRRTAEDEWLQEFPDALDYKPVGEEAVNGRPALLLSAEPRPGYTPRNMRARVFEKMRARLWIDKESSELAKADAEMFDTVNVGLGLLGRIEKGTRFQLQRRPVGPGVWFTERQWNRFAARVLLFKSMQQESLLELFDFRPR